LRLYLDTADPSDWEDFMPTRAFYGITTNPLLTQQLGLNYGEIAWEDMVSKAAELGAKEFHAQIHGDAKKAFSFAEHLYGLGRSLDIECVIKIPLTLEGISLAPRIKEFGAKILMTACYEPKQMITACALKADYVAPYVGRMMDAGLDAMANMQIIEKIARKNKCIPIIASLRNAKQMVEIAEIGHDCFTISPDVARDLFNSKLTAGAAIAFEEAAKWDKK
jgi:transaldolase